MKQFNSTLLNHNKAQHLNDKECKNKAWVKNITLNHSKAQHLNDKECKNKVWVENITFKLQQSSTLKW